VSFSPTWRWYGDDYSCRRVKTNGNKIPRWQNQPMDFCLAARTEDLYVGGRRELLEAKTWLRPDPGDSQSDCARTSKLTKGVRSPSSLHKQRLSSRSVLRFLGSYWKSKGLYITQDDFSLSHLVAYLTSYESSVSNIWDGPFSTHGPAALDRAPDIRFEPAIARHTPASPPILGGSFH